MMGKTYLLGLLFFSLCFLIVSSIEFLKNKNSIFKHKTSLSKFNTYSAFLVLFIVAITALIQTRLQTIQLLSIPLLAILVFKKHNFSNNQNISFLEIISVFTISFLLFFIAFGLPQNDSDINIHYDIHWYAKLSQKIMEGRSEHIGVLLTSYVENNGISLYHFSDLWFTGFFAWVFNLSHIAILSFFTYPILLTLGIFSLKEFLSQIGFDASKLKTYLIIFLVLFGMSLPVCLVQSAFFELSYSRYLFAPGFNIGSTKTLILLPIITLSISSLFRKDYLIFVSYMLLATISFSTTLILFSFILFLMLFYKLVLDFKANNWNTTINYSLIILLIGFYTSLILMLINWVDFSILPSSSNELSIKSIIVLFIEYNLSPLLVYAIPLLCILTLKSKERKWLSIKLSIVLILSISFTAIYVIKQSGEPNVVQAITNTVPFFFILLTLYTFESSKKIFRNVLIGIFSFSAMYNVLNQTLNNGSYSEDEKKIQEIFKNETTSLRWAIIDNSLTQNKYYKWEQSGYFLFFIKNIDYPIDFSNFFLLDKKEINKLPTINKGPLEQLFTTSQNKSKESVFKDFINKNEIFIIFCINKEANKMIKKLSLKDKKIKLVYSNCELGLWKVE